ncbi:MAG: DUF2232 domain-containing protein [bacterium]|nr:DUF2232 domain-containing protein [bacterium]
MPTSKKIILLSLVSLCFFISWRFFAFGQLFFQVLVPLPIIVCVYLLDVRKGFLCFFIMASGIYLIFQNHFLAILSIQLGLLGLVTGIILKNKFSFVKTVVLSTVVLSLISLLAILVISLHNRNFLNVIYMNLQIQMDKSLKIYEETGISKENIELVKKSFGTVLNTIKISFPAIIFILNFLIVSINLFFSKKILGLKHLKSSSFKTWRLRDECIWVFIICAIMTFLLKYAKFQSGYIIGLNLLIIISAVYLVSGLAITNFFFDKWKVFPFVKVLIYVLVFTSPIFLMLIIILGLIDFWFDFRGRVAAKEKS